MAMLSRSKYVYSRILQTHNYHNVTNKFNIKILTLVLQNVKLCVFSNKKYNFNGFNAIRDFYGTQKSD